MARPSLSPGVTKEDSKMKSMPCSFVLALLCVLFEELMHSTLYFSQASSEDVFHLLQKQTNETYCFIPNLMDILCAIGTVEQAEQLNYLAGGQSPL
eukprot:1144577-Pelagomonas_calceolata.AAC.1